MVNLKVARAIKNFTQEELSKKSGVSRTTISLIENKGVKGVTVDVIMKLSKTLEISIDELLSEK